MSGAQTGKQMRRLTDQALRAAALPAKGARLELTDSGCAGLVFRITDKGARTFSFRFRDPKTGRPGRVTLGRYPDLTLSKARKKADAYRVDVANGINPAEARKREKQTAASRSFGAVAARYIEERAKRHNAPSYVKNSESNLKNHILPVWKNRHIDTITRADVIELTEKLIAAKKPVQANRVQALISTIYSFALDAELCKFNPCHRLRKRGVEKPAKRVLSDDELRLLWTRAVVSPLSRQTGLALRLMLLSGCRPGEIAGLSRAELENFADAEQAALHLPGERTKNGRPHVVPLPALARETIAAALELIPPEQQFIFPSRLKNGGGMRAHSLTVAMKRLKPNGDAGADTWKAARPTPHDLRRTFRTRLSVLGVPKDVRDRLMNHAPRDVGERHYDQHGFFPEKRSALMTWAGCLAGIVGNSAVAT